MRQDKIYRLECQDEGGHDFFLVLNADNDSASLYIFKDEPSKDTEWEQATAIIDLDIEDSPDALRVMAHIWDDRDDKERFSSSVITIIEEEKGEQGDAN